MSDAQAHPQPITGRDLNTLSAPDFAPYLGERITVRHASGFTTEMELCQVEALRPIPRIRPIPGVSLTLWSTLERMLPQEIFTLSHPAMGEMTVTVVPIGPHGGPREDESGWAYQVVLN